VSAVVSTFLLIAGAFFLLVSTVGLLRLPDFFTRAHAVGKSETLGALLILGGLAVHNGLELETAKLFLIVLFIAVTNPTGVHTLTRAALRAGEVIWTTHGEETAAPSVATAPGAIVHEPEEGAPAPDAAPRPPEPGGDER
jgi:multicomponent Na+:H+ antiporter subunit G